MRRQLTAIRDSSQETLERLEMAIGYSSFDAF